MPRSIILAAAALACANVAVAAERRELGAHQHGHGTLNIAVEGNSVSIEFEAPGDDIAGFEHEAKTAQDKATLEKAISTLKAPLALFKFPDAAGCTVKDAKAKLEEEDEHEHAGEAAKAESKDEHDHEAHHAAFHAEYLLDCKSPAGLQSLTLGYFAAFKNAQSLTVGVITPKGQSKFEATRDKPVIDLSSVM